MTDLPPPAFASDEDCLTARIGLVALRLSIEVNRLRTLRGDGREDRFAGVLMRDGDIAALCADLIATPLPPSADLAASLTSARTRYDARLAALPSLPTHDTADAQLGQERAWRGFGGSGHENAVKRPEPKDAFSRSLRRQGQAASSRLH